jgi:hypothetical protein
MRHLAVLVLIISAFLWLSSPAPQVSLARAAPSPGCQEVNNSSHDGMYGMTGVSALDYYAGETLTIAASQPTSNGTAATIYLFVGGALVDIGGFPGTLTYTFAADTNTPLTWFPSGGDKVTWAASCTDPAGSDSKSSSSKKPDKKSVVVPGCDVFLDIPDTAVVGAFVQTVVADWAPGEATAPAVTLEAGKTAWVLGVDESLAYYKIFWGCQTLWVPVGAMGPNPDDVWHSKPLPAVVVS